MKTLLSVLLVMALQATAGTQVKVISRETMSMVDEPKQAVARSAAEWSALWRQHAGDKPLPPIDFGSTMVVAVFLGTRSSAGFAADITGVREANGILVVEWQERRPENREVSAQILTSPAVIASVPKFAGEVRFEKVER
jgi:PrcB C-terminal